jgi:hypothetical protein
MAAFVSTISASQKKAPDCSGAFFLLLGQVFSLCPAYVSRLQPLGSFYDIKRHFVALDKGFETIPLDGGEMHEDIFPVLLLKKTKPLAVVKPFYLAVYHLFFLLMLLKCFFQDSMSLDWRKFSNYCRSMSSCLFCAVKYFPTCTACAIFPPAGMLAGEGLEDRLPNFTCSRFSWFN